MISSVIFSLAITEVLLALFWPHKITVHPYHEQYHPIMGWVNKPNMDGRIRVSSGAFFYRKHNSKGLRALREISYDKPAVCIRGDMALFLAAEWTALFWRTVYC